MSGQRTAASASKLEEIEAALADGTDRIMRADARRNQERLIAAAKEVFTTQGGGASMEAIAKQAGVGVGTLYRHFPRRIDIVEAVYRTDVDDVVIAGEKGATEFEPWPALVAWLEAWLRYAQGKRVFLSELHEAFDKNPELKVESRERLVRSLDLVLKRAQEAGLARGDIDGADLMQVMGPMCTSPTLTDEQGERLLGVILDGLRTTK